jgi:hypothetical protein
LCPVTKQDTAFLIFVFVCAMAAMVAVVFALTSSA